VAPEEQALLKVIANNLDISGPGRGIDHSV
jgi:hypothetical protein